MNEHPSFFTCNSHIMHSTLTSNKSVEYENLIGEFEASLNKMRTTQKNVDSAIQTEESLLNEINKNYQKDFEELDDKKNILQETIAQQKRNIAQLEQKLPLKIDSSLADRVSEKQKETENLIKHRELALAKRNELSQKIRQRKQEKNDKIFLEEQNKILTEKELNTYRHALQLEIINESEAIKFEFKCIDKKALKKIYSVTLTINDSNIYTVNECHPKSTLPQVLQKLKTLNEDRELFVFIKSVRRIFQESTNA
ncbi:hypothetical protein INT46_007774 [Mucor plumbeus]|uniref:Kinetochore protein SPC25 n=1 Tax=Mucor plumbeus TaxID=97098 RepID=A0A8H7UWR3_9FUNG|nr:hypothetical protein INT46_007774 [Mucor plumbeus]